MEDTEREALHGNLGWHDESALLARLREQQSQLVSETLARAAHNDVVASENERLAEDLAGSRDRLQEVHHRVRNHLQTVTGLLSAQEISEHSTTARRALQKSIARLTSIAAIHDLLARDASSGELQLPELARHLSQHLLDQAGAESRLRVHIDMASVSLPSREATAFVLILTELLSNAIEHGFPGKGSGGIMVLLTRDGADAVLELKDTGRGLPPGFDISLTDSLGLKLVARLAERDLRGSIAAWNAEGACFRVRFPID
jgi:two-component sensor histidine kinase